MCAIIEDICHVVGRPKNKATICKVCKIPLTFENTRETGKGSLRKICRDCERKQNTINRAAQRDLEKITANYKRFLTGKQKYLHYVKIVKDVREPVEYTFTNKTNTTVQTLPKYSKNVEKLLSKWHFTIDKKCPECGGKIRYWPGTYEKVCEVCGLIDETPEYHPEYSYDPDSYSTENHRAKPVPVGIITDEELKLLRQIRKEGDFDEDI